MLMVIGSLHLVKEKSLVGLLVRLTNCVDARTEHRLEGLS